MIPVADADADAADAEAKRFIGSPTIRDRRDRRRGIGCRDAAVYAYGCRVYTDGSRTVGWPSVDQIRQALQREQRE